MKSLIQLAVVFFLSGICHASPIGLNPEWDKTVINARQGIAASNKRPIAPNELYACRVIVILNDELASLKRVNVLMENVGAKSKSGGVVVAGNADWLPIIAAARRQNARLSHLTPVPREMASVHQKLLASSVSWDSYLNLAKSVLYTRDPMMTNELEQFGRKAFEDAIDAMKEMRTISEKAKSTPKPN